MGRGFPHRLDGGDGVARIDFHLEQRRIRLRARGRCHRVRSVERDGDGSDAFTGLGDAQHLRDAAARELGFKVPQRAIERVARRARRERGLKLCARQACFERRREVCDLRQHAVDAFAVARVRHALALPHTPVSMCFDEHDLGGVLDAARDAERAAQRPAFAICDELAKHSSNRSTIWSTPMAIGSCAGKPRSSLAAKQARCAACGERLRC